LFDATRQQDYFVAMEAKKSFTEIGKQGWIFIVMCIAAVG